MARIEISKEETFDLIDFTILEGGDPYFDLKLGLDDSFINYKTSRSSSGLCFTRCEYINTYIDWIEINERNFFSKEEIKNKLEEDFNNPNMISTEILPTSIYDKWRNSYIKPARG